MNFKEKFCCINPFKFWKGYFTFKRHITNLEEENSQFKTKIKDLNNMICGYINKEYKLQDDISFLLKKINRLEIRNRDLKEENKNLKQQLADNVQRRIELAKMYDELKEKKENDS